LIAHKKAAHPFKCDKCDFVTASSTALAQHNASKHASNNISNNSNGNHNNGSRSDEEVEESEGGVMFLDD